MSKKPHNSDKTYYPPVAPDISESLDKLTRQRSHEQNNKELIAAVKNLTNQIRKIQTQTQNKASYDPVNNQIIIGNKKTPQTRGFRAELLKTLFKNDKSKKKKWFMDEIFNKLEGDVSRQLGVFEGFSKKVYSACDGINKQVAVNIAINDLLLFDKFSVQINPNYI